MQKLSVEQMRWFRLVRSGLVEPLASAEAVASALFGVQAQILPAAALALWNRTTGLSEARVDEQLFDQRSLVKLWGQRGTLHLYASHDWPLLHAATTINRTWWERQLAASDLARHEMLVEQVAALLRQRETLGRSDLRAAGFDLQEEHFSAWGGIFADLVRKGYACHAARDGGEGRFAHRERWLPTLPWRPPPADAANVTILRRFLAAYGPATLQDFAYWRGIAVNQARPWWQSLAQELAEVAVEGQPLWALQADLAPLTAPAPPAADWPVRMLYRFDPLLLAHREKSWVTDDAHYNRIWRPAGHIEGIVLVHGRAQATWRYERQGRGLVITVSPFGKLPRHVSKAVTKIAPQIAAFFGLPLVELKM